MGKNICSGRGGVGWGVINKIIIIITTHILKRVTLKNQAVIRTMSEERGIFVFIMFFEVKSKSAI